MQDMLISASVVTAIFLIFKLLDNKLRKLKLNGKELIKDLLIIFLSVFGRCALCLCFFRWVVSPAYTEDLSYR